MKRFTKVFSLFMIAVFVLVFAVGQAKADFWALNSETGYDSDNMVEALAEHIFDIGQENKDLTENEAEVESETGDNSTSYNTGTGEVVSGDVLIGGLYDNEANISLIESDGIDFGDFFAGNDTTGAESDNEAEVKLEQKAYVHSHNDYEVENEAEIEAETGDNDADANTGHGLITSGSGLVEAGFSNTANGLMLDLNRYFDSTGMSTMAVNDTTGAKSDNESEIEIENHLMAWSHNDFEAENEVEAEIETGDNSASENTGHGIIESGAAEALVVGENGANMNVVNAEITADGSEMVAVNDTTGYKSDNEAEIEMENLVKLMMMNMAKVENEAEVKLQTGDNEADHNTGNGEIVSGDASAGVVIDNGSGMNQNIVDLTMDLGDMSILIGNGTTGAHSDNEAEAEVENKVELKNMNFGKIENDEVEVKVETGDNSASGNTGSGSVTSGSGDASALLQNNINYNETSLHFSPSVDISAMNQVTGADSDNEVKAEVENKVSVENSNCAMVENEIEMEVKTGDNKADYNTGNGTTETGNSTILFGVSNTANGNSTVIGE